MVNCTESNMEVVDIKLVEEENSTLVVLLDLVPHGLDHEARFLNPG